jgi:CCR4-NOT transcription complex subunit 10
LQNDFLTTIKNILSQFLNSIPAQSVPNLTAFQDLNSIVQQNEFKSNYIFLNLLKSSQTLVKQISGLNLESANSQLFNNLAIVHFNLKKYMTSALYFQKSLEQNQAQQAVKSSNNKEYDILYNLGVSLLYAKQPLVAFECFQKIVHQFNQNARLWLRLAECCIVCYKHSLSETDQQAGETTTEERENNVNYNSTVIGNERIFKLSEKIRCINRAFGHGFHHKIQIEGSLSQDRASQGHKIGQFKEKSVSIAQLLTLEYAYMCLKNALTLLPLNDKQFLSCLKSSTTGSESIKLLDEPSESGEEQIDSEIPNLKPTTLNHSQTQKYFNCVWPSKPLSLQQLQNVRSSILISLSYVSLCLKDYMNTIKYSNTLLDSTNDLFNIKFPVSKGTRYLAHSYLAEALLYADRLHESIEHLNVNAKLESDAEITFMPPINTNSQENGNFNSQILSITVLRLNIITFQAKLQNINHFFLT